MPDKLSQPIAVMQAHQQPEVKLGVGDKTPTDQHGGMRLLPEEGEGVTTATNTGTDEDFVAEFKKVDSSQIDCIAHSGTKLRVRFHNGAIYEYAGVSRELYLKVLEADSVGKMFNAEIKAKAALFPFKKV